MIPSTASSFRYPRRRIIRSILRVGIAAAFKVLADFDIQGKDNLPTCGPLILVGNHFSFLDPVAMIHITRYPLEFLGGLRTPNAPAWTNIFRILWGTILIRRGASSREGLLAAQNVLEQNGVVSIFPEGGNWATVLRPPRPGVALLAAKTDARIVPIGFDGLLDVFPSIGKGRRGRVIIRIGKPYRPTARGAQVTLRQHMEEIGHEMMRHIADLIPPERRGFYSSDPVVREAAKGTEIYPWESIAET